MIEMIDNWVGIMRRGECKQFYHVVNFYHSHCSELELEWEKILFASLFNRTTNSSLSPLIIQ